eukprot:CAMPEP_0184871896 /NCGR_PEP_ID=MMETSP0580-20130426/40980_1 /TAXON_ID=1118495 /ORGANISM="Dactyliosolen fragilissimus" /LENGTH=207 /DNA_ID=CAMNT_0027374615 /DNA_START=427 /DNA_END=1050 /DNA_ORIENTATION=-
MAFSQSALMAVLVASMAVYTSNAFAPINIPNSRQFGLCQPTRFNALSVSLASVADLTDEDSDEPAPEDFIVNAGDLDDEPAATADDSTSGWYALDQRITEARNSFRLSEKDTGSPEYQVAGMTERISYLTEHLKVHPKDFSTRRGLVALVNKRRRLLNYLFREDINRYQNIVKTMGIRHKAPSRVQTKEEKYGRFPSQKPNKYKNKN